jgi:hypothetical protein
VRPLAAARVLCARARARPQGLARATLRHEVAAAGVLVVICVCADITFTCYIFFNIYINRIATTTLIIRRTSYYCFLAINFLATTTLIIIPTSGRRSASPGRRRLASIAWPPPPPGRSLRARVRRACEVDTIFHTARWVGGGGSDDRAPGPAGQVQGKCGRVCQSPCLRSPRGAPGARLGRPSWE